MATEIDILKHKIKTNIMENNVKPLIVTTAHQGVFFGYGVPSDGPTIELSKAKMAVYWTSDMKGVCGLATRGPGPGCRIGPSVQKMIVRDVTAVMETTEEAAANWEKEIWS